MYAAQISLGSKQIAANLLAVDRVHFAGVVPHFRDEWLGNGNSMGALMNALAQARDGAILSASMAGNTKIGDNIAVTVDIDGTQVATKVRVVAIVSGWPGQYDAEQPFLVTNQSFIAEEMGFTPPSDVWMTRDTALGRNPKVKTKGESMCKRPSNLSLPTATVCIVHTSQQVSTGVKDCF